MINSIKIYLDISWTQKDKVQISEDSLVIGIISFSHQVSRKVFLFWRMWSVGITSSRAELIPTKITTPTS